MFLQRILLPFLTSNCPSLSLNGAQCMCVRRRERKRVCGCSFISLVHRISRLYNVRYLYLGICGMLLIYTLTCTLILVTLYLRSILICMGMSKNIFPCAKFTRHRFTFAFTSQKLQQFSFGYKVIIMMKRAKMCGKHSSFSLRPFRSNSLRRCRLLHTANSQKIL